MKEKLPNHMKNEYKTLRNFKRIKRLEFIDMIKSFSKTSEGSAFYPQEAYLKLDKARTLTDEAHKELKIWWKNA